MPGSIIILYYHTTMSSAFMYLKNLTKIRKKKGWSQEKLAAESGVSYNTIIKIEAGRIDDPRISTALKFAKALKISLDDLVR